MRSGGSALVVGLLLLSLVSLLSLAGASAAHLELQLARNGQFRENAASAASAGIETAISRIVTSSTPEAVPTDFAASLPGTRDRFEVHVRLLGYEATLPHEPGVSVAGAHFEITSTGHSSRGAIDLQRAIVLQVVDSPTPASPLDCEPAVAGVRCARAGQWRRMSWQRLPRP
jgi:Tfp pilus assembly protein PilX